MTRQGPGKVLCTAAVLATLSVLQPSSAALAGGDAAEPGESAKSKQARPLDKLTVTVAHRAQIEVRSLLEAIGRHQQCQVLAGSRINQRKLEPIGTGTLDYGDIEALLRSAGILLCWQEDGGRMRLHAVEEREATERLTFAPKFVKPGEPLPARTTLVTSVFPIRHTESMVLYAVVRAIASRDRTRLTDVVHHRDSSMLVVRGLSDQVRGILRIAAELDQPSIEMRVRATLVELPLAGSGAGRTMTRAEAIKAAGEAGPKLDAIVKVRGRAEVRAVIDPEETPSAEGDPGGRGTAVLKFTATGPGPRPQLSVQAHGRFSLRSSHGAEVGEVRALYQAAAHGRRTLLFVERLPDGE